MPGLILPHDIEHWRGSIARVRDAAGRLDLVTDRALLEDEEIVVENVEADEQVALRVEVPEQPPEGSQRPWLIHVELHSTTVSSEYPSVNDLAAYIFDNQADTENTGILAS